MNKNSAVRVKNIGTANGATVNDDRAFEALAKFPVGVTPDVCLMNRRTLEQLRKSRTNVTSRTGVPMLPDSVAGIPIVVTDLIVNAEAQGKNLANFFAQTCPWYMFYHSHVWNIHQRNPVPKPHRPPGILSGARP